MNRYGSRKFLLSVFFAIAGTALCATGKLSGEQFVYLVGICTGIHHAANYYDSKLGGQTAPVTTP